MVSDGVLWGSKWTPSFLGLDPGPAREDTLSDLGGGVHARAAHLQPNVSPPPRSCQENFLFSAPCHVTHRPRFARATAFARPSASSCHRTAPRMDLIPSWCAGAKTKSTCTLPASYPPFSSLVIFPPLPCEGGCFGLFHAQINSDLQQRSPDLNQKMDPHAQKVRRSGSGSSAGGQWRRATLAFNSSLLSIFHLFSCFRFQTRPTCVFLLDLCITEIIHLVPEFLQTFSGD